VATLQVALPVPISHAFDYLAPTPAPPPGSRVRVPFGHGERVGVVLGHADGAPAPRLKPIHAVLDAEALLDAELLTSLRRAADYWCGAIGDVVLGALPKALRDGRPTGGFGAEAWAVTPAGKTARAAGTRHGGSDALLATLGPDVL
jgi:primosomal protein N' (replication factor Y)